MFEFYQIIMRCVINFPNFVAAWNHMVCDIYCEILANLLKFYTQYHNIADALFTSSIELSTESRETKMAVDRWGKDGEAANAALRGFGKRAKAAFAALRGDRVKPELSISPIDLVNLKNKVNENIIIVRRGSF